MSPAPTVVATPGAGGTVEVEILAPTIAPVVTSTARIPEPRRTKNLSITSPTSAEHVSWRWEDRQTRVVKATVTLKGGGASATWTLEHSTSMSTAPGAGTAIVTDRVTTNTTDGDEVVVDVLLPVGTYLHFSTSAMVGATALDLKVSYEPA